jgi:pimeloyl-ACP methyl ester carboxylesterase
MLPVRYLNTPHHPLAYKYQAQNNAPTLVFLPGYFSDMSGLKATYLEQLALDKKWGYLSLDYSGHGQSGGQFQEGTIGQWYQDTLAVINHTQATNLILVGSSMGGWLMLLTALKIPEKIKGLVGIAPAPDFTETLIWQKLSADQQDHLKTTGYLTLPSQYNAGGTPVSYQLIREARNHLLLHSGIKIQAPVRLLHGTADEDVPFATSIQLLDQLTTLDGQILLIKDGDHRLSQPEHLKMLAQIITNLVKG